MNLFRALENNKLRGMDHDFSEEAWNEFHNGNINTEEDLHDHLFAYIETQVIYTNDCEAILEGNSEYYFDEHDAFGRPESVPQAAFAVVYDYITSSVDTVTWYEMEQVLNEA